MQNAALLPIAPELVLLIGMLGVVTSAVLLGRDRREWGSIAGVALAVAAVLAVMQWLSLGGEPGTLHYSARGLSIVRSPMVVMDAYSAFAGVAIFSLGLLGLLAAWDLVETLGDRGAEFVALLLLAVAGLHGMAMSSNLVLLFLSLETASISFYVMAGFTRDRLDADEAALKYFLLGSLASAVFVYGIALSFAAIGSTTIYGAGGIRDFFSNTIVTERGVLLVGIVMIIVGLGFKVSAAPFHQWAPDVYQGAPGGAVGLMAAGVKLAGFIAIGRVLAAGFAAQIDQWASIIAIVAGISVILGTSLAAVQKDVKRLLAYSGVAHAGYILTAVTAGIFGISALLFYVTTYAAMLLGAFAIAGVVTGPREGPSPFAAWAGLRTRSPELAMAMAVLLLGLGGIPFTAGFVGKIQVFTAAASAGYLWLVVLALLTTVIGLYFYLKVIKVMFIDPVADDTDPIEASITTRTVFAVAVGVTILFGLVPWPLLDIVRDALPL